MASEKMVCEKCGRERALKEFFTYKNGTRCELCKDCLTQYIDNRDSSTFIWILEKFDVPYVEQEWIKISNAVYKKNPGAFGPKSVIGRYLRNMKNMVQFKDTCYADSDRLNFENSKAERTQQQIEEMRQHEEKLQEQLKNGEITLAEYSTLTHTNDDDVPANIKSELPPLIVDDSYWRDQLTDEDIKYLMLKWGSTYTPEDWIKMETMWTKYTDQYAMNVDREEILKKICKTSLKMEKALDVDDVKSYKDLSSVFDQLRKSGKFTDAQVKEDSKEKMSTIGELVALCEREGGIIEALPQYDPHQYPQDKIDFTLKDLESYTYNLVSKELGLGDLIETYIQKLEKSEEDSADIQDGLVTSAEEAEANGLTTLDYENFSQFIEQEVAADEEVV